MKNAASCYPYPQMGIAMNGHSSQHIYNIPRGKEDSNVPVYEEPILPNVKSPKMQQATSRWVDGGVDALAELGMGLQVLRTELEKIKDGDEDIMRAMERYTRHLDGNLTSLAQNVAALYDKMGSIVDILDRYQSENKVRDTCIWMLRANVAALNKKSVMADSNATSPNNAIPDARRFISMDKFQNYLGAVASVNPFRTGTGLAPYEQRYSPKQQRLHHLEEPTNLNLVVGENESLVEKILIFNGSDTGANGADARVKGLGLRAMPNAPDPYCSVDERKSYWTNQIMKHEASFCKTLKIFPEQSSAGKVSPPDGHGIGEYHPDQTTKITESVCALLDHHEHFLRKLEERCGNCGKTSMDNVKESPFPNITDLVEEFLGSPPNMVPYQETLPHRYLTYAKEVCSAYVNSRGNDRAMQGELEYSLAPLAHVNRFALLFQLLTNQEPVEKIQERYRCEVGTEEEQRILLRNADECSVVLKHMVTGINAYLKRMVASRTNDRIRSKVGHQMEKFAKFNPKCRNGTLGGSGSIGSGVEDHAESDSYYETEGLNAVPKKTPSYIARSSPPTRNVGMGSHTKENGKIDSCLVVTNVIGRSCHDQPDVDDGIQTASLGFVPSVNHFKERYYESTKLHNGSCGPAPRTNKSVTDESWHRENGITKISESPPASPAYCRDGTGGLVSNATVAEFSPYVNEPFRPNGQFVGIPNGVTKADRGNANVIVTKSTCQTPLSTFCPPLFTLTKAPVSCVTYYEDLIQTSTSHSSSSSFDSLSELLGNGSGSDPKNPHALTNSSESVPKNPITSDPINFLDLVSKTLPGSVPVDPLSGCQSLVPDSHLTMGCTNVHENRSTHCNVNHPISDSISRFSPTIYNLPGRKKALPPPHHFESPPAPPSSSSPESGEVSGLIPNDGKLPNGRSTRKRLPPRIVKALRLSNNVHKNNCPSGSPDSRSPPPPVSFGPAQTSISPVQTASGDSKFKLSLRLAGPGVDLRYDDTQPAPAFVRPVFQWHNGQIFQGKGSAPLATPENTATPCLSLGFMEVAKRHGIVPVPATLHMGGSGRAGEGVSGNGKPQRRVSFLMDRQYGDKVARSSKLPAPKMLPKAGFTIVPTVKELDKLAPENWNVGKGDGASRESCTEKGADSLKRNTSFKNKKRHLTNPLRAIFQHKKM